MWESGFKPGTVGHRSPLTSYCIPDCALPRGGCPTGSLRETKTAVGHIGLRRVEVCAWGCRRVWQRLRWERPCPALQETATGPLRHGRRCRPNCCGRLKKPAQPPTGSLCPLLSDLYCRGGIWHLGSGGHSPGLLWELCGIF